MPRSRAALTAFSLAAALAASALAETEQLCREDAMIVFDGSGSMSLMDVEGRPRIDVARQSVAAVLPEVTENRKTGLVVYGAGGSCHVELMLRPKRDAAREITDMVARMPATGATPLSRAILEAALALGGGPKPGVIVVVTDGEDNCGLDPCRMAKDLKAFAPKVVVHIVGFMMGPQQAVRAACVAEETGGLYVPAKSFDELKAALRAALGCPKVSARGERFALRATKREP